MSNKILVLTAMIFAVAMMFIDQTIVSLAIPNLNHDLKLSPTAAQWIVNGYLLSLAALFPLGGRVADIVGHRTTLLGGVFCFALFSALCGATPTGSGGEEWIIAFRVLQGASAAFLFPAALAIVVSSFDIDERGKYLAAFFSISGALTSVGPIAGGYLTAWTWRAIFWVNVPVALIAIVLTLIAKPHQDAHRAESLDMTGAILSIGGMGLAVLGLQQASAWGWSSVATWACLVVGVILIAIFVRWELRVEQPLVPMRLFGNRAFAVDNAVLFLLSICFVPLFFFASLYAQIALGYSSSNAGLMLLVFFGGFALASQWGGRILDTRGARPTVVLGCAVAAVGFYLWAVKLPALSFGNQWPYLAIAGAGMGLVLGPVSTDALNRAASTAYGAVSGVTQTVRNFGGSLGLAVLGSILVTNVVSKVEDTLTGHGVPQGVASRIAHAVSGASTGGGSGSSGFGRAPHSIVHDVQHDFGTATKTVVIGMAAAMAVAFVLSLVAMPGGRPDEEVVADAQPPETTSSSPTGAAAAGR
ncbi:MAG TPA: MFS transporter [Solirubrobacteraceae bacterium]|nr:MFS transporter [Solirubrobacteraceae bacterium]